MHYFPVVQIWPFLFVQIQVFTLLLGCESAVSLRVPSTHSLSMAVVPHVQPWLLRQTGSPHRCGPQGTGRREFPGIPHQPKRCSSSGFSFSLVPSVISAVRVASQGLCLPPSVVPGSPHSPVGSREVRQALRKAYLGR